jgi:DNA-binding XRE family transcriptional regulator
MPNFFEKRRAHLSKHRGETVSQNDIARKINMTANAVGQWERYQSVPSLKIAGKLAEVYCVPLEQMEREIAALARAVVAREESKAAVAAKC